MSDPIRRLPLEAAGRRATSADVREEIDNLEGFLRGLLIGQDRLRDAMVERVAEFRAALSTTPAPLDAAWAEAEAALPDGWHLSLWRTMSGDALGYGIEAMLDYGTGEDRVNRVEFVHGPTPAAALLALAEKLREYAKP